MTRNSANWENLIPPYRKFIRKRTLRRYVQREIAAYLKVQHKREETVETSVDKAQE